MRHTRLLLILPLLATLAHSPVQAQPAPRPEAPPTQIMQRITRPRLSEEQLRQLRVQQAEIRSINLKSQLTRAGFTDEALQTAVANEYKAQEAGNTDLLAKWRKITAAIAANNTTADDMAALLKDFRDSLDKEKTRHQAASKSLEDQYQVSKKPLLDAILMTMGVTGNEAATIGQASGVAGQITNFFGAPDLNF